MVYLFRLASCYRPSSCSLPFCWRVCSTTSLPHSHRSRAQEDAPMPSWAALTHPPRKHPRDLERVQLKSALLTASLQADRVFPDFLVVLMPIYVHFWSHLAKPHSLSWKWRRDLWIAQGPRFLPPPAPSPLRNSVNNTCVGTHCTFHWADSWWDLYLTLKKLLFASRATQGSHQELQHCRPSVVRKPQATSMFKHNLHTIFFNHYFSFRIPIGFYQVSNHYLSLM